MKRNFFILNENYDVVNKVRTDENNTYWICNAKTPIVLSVFLFFALVFVSLLAIRTSKEADKYNVQAHILETKCDTYYNEYQDAELHYLIGKFAITGTTEIDKDTLYNFIHGCGLFWYPDVVFAQCVIESGCGASELYKKGNNLLGMRQPLKRETTAIVPCISPNGYAYYKNWQSCILDRVLWEHAVFKNKPSKEKYISTIQNIYAEDPNYGQKINSLTRKK